VRRRLRQFFKVIVNEDDGAVRQPVVTDNHGLLDGAEVGVLSQDLLLHYSIGRKKRGVRLEWSPREASHPPLAMAFLVSLLWSQESSSFCGQLLNLGSALVAYFCTAIGGELAEWWWYNRAPVNWHHPPSPAGWRHAEEDTSLPIV